MSTKYVRKILKFEHINKIGSQYPLFRTEIEGNYPLPPKPGLRDAADAEAGDFENRAGAVLGGGFNRKAAVGGGAGVVDAGHGGHV